MARTASKEKVEQALYDLGLVVNDDNAAQMQVMVEAMFIYQEREAVRGGLWKEAGAMDSAGHLRSKAMRVKHAIDHAMPEAAIDDAHDAVNYSAFYIRNVRANRLVGD